MLQLFLETTGRVLVLCAASVLPAHAGRLASWRRVLVMLALLPAFLVVQGIHWLGFALDEIFFRGYRRVMIREPLFVLGVPRSGTTHLHRVLAKDPQFTTFSTWECLFALSVTERKLWLGVARIDRLIGAPLTRLVDWLETHAFGTLEQIHPMRLDDPEEDYFALTPVLACFILILPFPQLALLWRMGTFDRDMPPTERKRLLDFYEGCLKRHLYVHGAHRRLLSKNAAFAPLANSLAERFPDARFIVCLRPPTEVVPSQISSLRSGMDLFGVEELCPDFRERLVEQLAFYYENLHRVVSDLPHEQRVSLEMRALGPELMATVEGAYRHLGLDLDPAFRVSLAEAQEQARQYRSGHRYTAAASGLSTRRIQERFDPIYQRFGLAADSRSATALSAAQSGTGAPVASDPPCQRERLNPC
jgi:hypothetical protein